jgi:hypothetical protein
MSSSTIFGRSKIMDTIYSCKAAIGARAGPIKLLAGKSTEKHLRAYSHMTNCDVNEQLNETEIEQIL